MTPSDFPQQNIIFKPPPDLEEAQCGSIPGYVGEVTGGSCDGCPLVVVAWLPTEEDLRRLDAGLPIFLTVIGGMPPHFLTTNFEEATHPA